MYEVLTGRPPFVAKTPETLARLHRDMAPQPPSMLNPEIAPELEQIIMKVLAKEPAARYRTADQLGRVLMTFGQSKTGPISVSKPAPAPSPNAVTTMVKPFDPQPAYAYPEPEPAPQVAEPAEEIDWLAVLLGLLALAAVGGLVPLWIAIYFRWTNALP